jgi:hypothetical protein
MLAQVTIPDQSTVQLGTAFNVVYAGHTGKYNQANNVQFGISTNPGTVIESGNGESSGLFMDKDKVVIWSPGNSNLVNFCNENSFQSGNTYSQALVAYITYHGYYYQYSDSTNKENIRTIESSLDKVLQLRGVEYNHKTVAGTYSIQTQKEKKKGDNNDDDSIVEYEPEIVVPNQPKTTEKSTGFLAQNVEQVIPEAVMTSETGIKYVNYQAIIPLLTEALKEQNLLIMQQSQELENLKKRIEKLESKQK